MADLYIDKFTEAQVTIYVDDIASECITNPRGFASLLNEIASRTKDWYANDFETAHAGLTQEAKDLLQKLSW